MSLPHSICIAIPIKRYVHRMDIVLRMILDAAGLLALRLLALIGYYVGSSAWPKRHPLGARRSADAARTKGQGAP